MSAQENFSRITPFLWFNANAEEAVEFYPTVFKNSCRISELRTTDDCFLPKGSILTIAFELEGQKFTALNGGPSHKFTEAVSFVVRCDSQQEVDDIGQNLRPEAASLPVVGSKTSLASPGRLCRRACLNSSSIPRRCRP
jgi:predicted 3-demethylubiquinone-9 3-methyltransferase (glyoxalase superfamily)